MGSLSDARRELAQVLAQGGLRVTTDPRNLELPCVLVDAPQAMEMVGKAGVAVGHVIQVIGPNPANEDTLDVLLDLVEQVTFLLPWTIQTVRFTSYDAAGKQYPAYVIVTTQTVSRPTC